MKRPREREGAPPRQRASAPYRSAAGFLAIVIGSLLIVIAAPAVAGLGDPAPSVFFPIRSLFGFPDQAPGLAQRAIEDEEEKKKPAGEVPPELSIPETPPLTTEIKPKSPTKAFLLSAAVPGLGELYSGSNRGYIFLGVEAASWITYASYKSSAGNKEDELYAYADRRFSIAAFETGCVGQPGQPCQEALDAINNFYLNDKGEYYEIISKNPIYKPGWGVQVQSDGSFTYENCDLGDLGCPPDPSQPGQEAAYRQWVADQAAAQDRDYIQYNGLRDDRNSLDSNARTATMVVLINHIASAFDALMVARGFNADLPQGVNMEFTIKTSLGNPGGKVVFKRKF
jgi:hypothetical protein